VAVRAADRALHRLAHGAHLTLAGEAEFIEALEPGDHVFQLAMGIAPGIGDRVGHVLGAVGDDRQLAAQLVHVVERAGRDMGDFVDLLAVVEDQRAQAVGMGGKAVGGDAAERVEIARLGGEEIAGEGQFGVHRAQAA
jgi:hypothetical protein